MVHSCKQTLSIGIIIFTLLASFTQQKAIAQFGGHFGSAVAVDDHHAFVMKPAGAFGGISAIYVFEQSAGSWSEHQRLFIEGAADRGEALNPSMAVHKEMLVASAADPFLQWGAHLFNKQNGAWQTPKRIPVKPDIDAEPSNSMSLNEFMQFVQPPGRSLAFNGQDIAISVQAGTSPYSGVHLFTRAGGSWKLSSTLELGGTRSGMQFGVSMALGDGFLVVGAPKGGNSGRAYIFEKNEADKWIETAVLESAAVKPNANMGSSIAVQGQRVVLGAPGNQNMPGMAVGFERNQADGAWREIAQFMPDDGEMNSQFGKAVAFIGNELWIGAPMADQATGKVYRFNWSNEPARLPPLSVEGTAPTWTFGMSLAGNSSFAVVGAPGANGGDGKAALFTNTGNGSWKLNSWLMPDLPLEPITGSERRCEDGNATGYDCNEVDLLSFLPIHSFGGAPGERVSDIWGWTDPLNNREYALIGRTGGAAIIDVSNPTQPVYVGIVPANPTNVRDLKVYKDHLFFTGDGAGNHGLVVFNLTRLRDVEKMPTSLSADTVYNGIASAHNLILDEESGFAYPVGASGGGETCGGGLHIVDIREPLNPTFAGCYTDTIGLFSDGRTHDGQCVVYNGPDERYRDREICMVSNETGLRIVDLTDKENPVPLSVARYPRVAYVHQGWFTDDHRYFYLNDELDELVGMTSRTRTLVWDVAELDDPVLVGEVAGETPSTDHNLYIKGDRMYQANYESGLRVWDVSSPESPREIGYFDTTPGTANPPGFYGAWTAYPYFESGTVIVSSIGEGLFVVKPRQQEQVP